MSDFVEKKLETSRFNYFSYKRGRALCKHYLLTCLFLHQISKIENVHEQQQGLNVDDYFEQNIQAKAVLTKFLSVVLAVVTLLFSIFTLIVHGIAPLTRTRSVKVLCYNVVTEIHNAVFLIMYICFFFMKLC